MNVEICEMCRPDTCVFPTMVKTAKQIEIKSSEVKEVFVVKRNLLYIAFNKETADAVVFSWQSAYNDLYKKGIVKEIFKKYDQEALYPSKL